LAPRASSESLPEEILAQIEKQIYGSEIPLSFFGGRDIKGYALPNLRNVCVHPYDSNGDLPAAQKQEDRARMDEKVAELYGVKEVPV